jgi:hypothetical protein
MLKLLSSALMGLCLTFATPVFAHHVGHDHAVTGPYRLPEVTLKAPKLIPGPHVLTYLVAKALGCSFTSLVQDQLECPVSVAPTNTYVASTFGHNLNVPEVIYVLVKHRTVMLEPLPTPVKTYIRPLVFETYKVWQGTDGNRNFEAFFQAEGQRYRLTFSYYDFGLEL